METLSLWALCPSWRKRLPGLEKDEPNGSEISWLEIVSPLNPPAQPLPLCRLEGCPYLHEKATFCQGHSCGRKRFRASRPRYLYSHSGHPVHVGLGASLGSDQLGVPSRNETGPQDPDENIRISHPSQAPPPIPACEPRTGSAGFFFRRPSDHSRRGFPLAQWESRSHVDKSKRDPASVIPWRHRAGSILQRRPAGAAL